MTLGGKRIGKKSDGSIVDFLSVCICVLAMTYVMTAFFGCNDALQKKVLIGQVTRNYLLKMETVGYLTGADQAALLTELSGLGMRDISLTGTTCSPVQYGDRIVLALTGKITVQLSIGRGDVFASGLGNKELVVSQKLTSTAKQ